MSHKHCPLQISISIGKDKHIIRVNDSEDLPNTVTLFLHQHGLSRKYKPAIIAMVQAQLIHKIHHQEETQPSTHLPLSHQPPKKQLLLHRIQQEMKKPPTHSKSPQNDNKQVYQEWKQLTRQKSQKIVPSKINPKTPQQSHITHATHNNKQNLPRHSPDHFYHKGLQFKTKQNQANESQFHSLYPFTTNPNPSPQTPLQQQSLTNRLIRQKNQSISPLKYADLHAVLAPKNPIKKDPYKQKLKEKEAELDSVLLEILQRERAGHQQRKDRCRSRSPFRTTRIY